MFVNKDNLYDDGCMNRTCIACNGPFSIEDADLDFYRRVSPVIGGKTYDIPPPTHCPDCRQLRRLAHCNERVLFPGTCGLCKKRTLTQFSPKSDQPYYCNECWHSDKWEPRDYCRDVDFTRPFYEQLAELRRTVPHLALSISGTCENSDYIHYAGTSKNCYLIMHADFCEDCYYGYGFKRNRSCVDGFYNLHSELLYDCIDCHKCYDLTASQDCQNCSSSAFLRDCTGCQNCFLCVGLRNKQYCFENKQLTKEEYQAKRRTIDTGSAAAWASMKERRRMLELEHPFKEFQGHNLEACSGNYLYNCKDVRDSFDCEDVEGGRFCTQIVLGAKNVYDAYQYGTNFQNAYETCICGEDSQNFLFCLDCHMSSSDLICCWYMERSQNCFGCAGMQRAKHCILNKQYAKEEYEALVPKIIEHMKSTGEWGEFLPARHALFGYNHTTANLWYPMMKGEAETRDFRWEDAQPEPPTVAKIIDAAQLPDNIRDIPDDVLQLAIRCELTGKSFRVIRRELEFCRRQTIPLPRRSPDQRHLDRFAKRNPRKFFDRQCGKCGKAIRTTYAPDRPEIVYCEQCYLQEVY